MATRFAFREFEAQQVEDVRLPCIEDAVSLLREELRPSLPQAAIAGSNLTFQNLIGSFSLANGDLIEVAPKVDADDWATAVVHLLSSDTRLAVGGSRRSHASERRADLSATLALEYARRLDSALKAEGPLQTYERRSEVSSKLNGKLETSGWVRSYPLHPSRFPISHDVLSPSNDFTRAFAVVAGLLGRSAVGGQSISRLRRLQQAILPGHAVPSYVNPTIGHRALPMQWRKYQPAWDIAAPLLRNRSVVGDPGRAAGLEVAVEPWPLLETLLERSLLEVARRSTLKWSPKTWHRLLTAIDGSVARSVEPDGLLKRQDGSVAATFEAKYTKAGVRPAREHVYQALSTAAALDSSLSVIVYPGDDEEKHYTLSGFGGKPAQLVTVGLSLFSYRRGAGDAEGARRILDALNHGSQPY